jgi:hypothetical protein
MEKHPGRRTASTSTRTATVSSPNHGSTNSFSKNGHITDRLIEIDFLDLGTAALCFTFG